MSETVSFTLAMEQHPIPQNVTTFQFRLIGDMTLKQFGYLAVGAILAYVCYKLPLPFFINWPLALLAAIGGFGFAFVPIEERPMDVWVMSFFKSVYSPTEYVWTRPASPPSASPMPGQPTIQNVPPPSMSPATPQQVGIQPSPTASGRRGDILTNLFNAPAPDRPGVLSTNTARVKRGPLDWLFDMLMPKPPQGSAPTPMPAPAPQVAYPSTIHARMDLTPPPSVKAREAAIADATKKEETLQHEVTTLQKELAGKEASDSRVAELQKQMSDLMRERDTMEAELARLRLQTSPAPAAPKPNGTYVATPASQKGPSVRIITPDRAVKAGLPRLTSVPNIVTGIVKDGEQNLLPGVIVTVKDKDGVPVRALKTNRLGQFAASTPISNGTYFVEVEDPRLRFTFDRAQITLNGSVVPALEIFAKTEKEITRAKLEKELFGTKPM